MEPKVIKEEAVDKESPPNYVENPSNCGGRTRSSRGMFFVTAKHTFKLNIGDGAVAGSFAQYFDGN